MSDAMPVVTRLEVSQLIKFDPTPAGVTITVEDLRSFPRKVVGQIPNQLSPTSSRLAHTSFLRWFIEDSRSQVDFIGGSAGIFRTIYKDFDY